METKVPESDGGAVLEFKRPLPHEEFERISRFDRTSYGKCRHVEKVLDDELRRVTCKECDEVLDPLQVLLDHAANWRMYHGPLVEQMKAFRERRRIDGEEFRAWWYRVGQRGREYRTKMAAAEDAWRIARGATMELAPAPSTDTKGE